MNASLLRNWRRPVQWVAIVMFVAALALGSVVADHQAVFAGSNGQMLRVGNACSNPALLTWVRIRGYNNYGSFATWESWPNKSVVTTDGWWWVGRVVIDWRTNRDSYLHSTAADVPKSYPTDYYRVLLDKWGC